MARGRVHDPVFQAVLDNVEDDAPRLVYADWLEARDDPRGEFIRVQCQLDKLADNDAARPPLLEREQQLISEYGADWLQDLPLLDDMLDWQGFHRGFPLAAIDFARIDQTLDDEALEYFESLNRKFNHFVQQGNPASLKLDSGYAEVDPCSVDFLEGAFGSPCLVHAIEINTTFGIELTNAVVKALAAATHFRTHLRRLKLICSNGPGDPEPNDEAVEALAGSPRMAYLRELMLLDGWVITDRGASALAASPYFGCLTRLDVGVYSHFMSTEGEQTLRARFGDRVHVNWM